MKKWKNEYQQQAYLKNKQKYISKAMIHNTAARERNRLYLINLKKEAVCICGIQDYRVMEFAHRDRKEKDGNLSNMASAPVSLKKLQEEASKCDILCANCHRIQTFEERKLIVG